MDPGAAVSDLEEYSRLRTPEESAQREQMSALAASLAELANAHESPPRAIPPDVTSPAAFHRPCDGNFAGGFLAYVLDLQADSVTTG